MSRLLPILLFLVLSAGAAWVILTNRPAPMIAPRMTAEAPVEMPVEIPVEGPAESAAEPRIAADIAAAPTQPDPIQPAPTPPSSEAAQAAEAAVLAALAASDRSPAPAAHAATNAPAGPATDPTGVASRIESLLTPQGFDPDQALRIIEDARIPDLQKQTLTRLIATTRGDPQLLADALDHVRAVMR